MNQNSLQSLDQILNRTIKVYRQLLEVVRREREILIEADLEELNENNAIKEKILIELREWEEKRILIVAQIAKENQINMEEPRLLDLANHFSGEKGDRLRNLHSVLVLLLKRVQEFNQQNEDLVRAALENISGALNNIKNHLQEKSTYERKGRLKEGTQDAHFVSKEA